MSERVDRKVQDVVVGRFEYRHEAEFAAGFLDDAGIPYRLQVDDAVLGMTIASPATLWVRGIDEAHARELLEPGPDPADHEWELAHEVGVEEVGEGAPGAVSTAEGGPPAPPPISRPAPHVPGFYSASGPPQPRQSSWGDSVARIREAGRTARLDAADASVETTDSPRSGRVEAGRLSPLERAIALLLCAAAGWIGVGLMGVPYGGWWTLVLGAAGVPMAIGAVVGRTVPPFDRVLRALSGSVP